MPGLTYSTLISQSTKVVQRFQPSEPLSTPLYSIPGSIDFATRVAKIIAKRTGKPAYVSSSVVFGSFGIEEEMAGLKAAVEGIMSIVATTKP